MIIRGINKSEFFLSLKTSMSVQQGMETVSRDAKIIREVSAAIVTADIAGFGIQADA